ncbi:MAG: hypothetical protein ACE14P_09435 [Methanotrichaceae archaeon]
MHKVDSDNSLIVSHGRERLSFWKCFKLNSFQSFASTVSGPLNQRGRKFWDALTDKHVGCIMVVNLVPRSVLKPPFSRDRERFGVSSHRIEESSAILVSQPELKCNRPKHIHIVGD